MIGSRHLRLLMPAGVVATLVAAAFAATGHGATESVNVPVTVLPEIHIGSTCGTTVALGTVLRGSSTTTTPCQVSFGTLNAPSAQLQVVDASSAWGMRDAGTGATIPDAPYVGSAALPSHSFGMRVTTVVAGTPSMTANIWYGLRPTATNVATTTGPSDGTANIQFGVNTSYATAPGAYANTVTFTAVAA